MRKVLVFLMVLMVSCLGQASAAVSVNEAAPDFTLMDSNGDTHSLSDYLGSYVVLEWVNYECPFVVKHYVSGNMQALQEEFASQDDVVWFSVNSSAEGKQGWFSSEEINEKIEERDAQPTAYLIDEDGEVGKTYGAKTTPHIFIINPEGVLVYQGAIDSIPSFDQSDIPDATNYVRAAFEDLRGGNPVSEPSTKSYGCSVKY